MEDSAPLPVVDHRVEGGGGHGQQGGDEAVLAQQPGTPPFFFELRFLAVVVFFRPGRVEARAEETEHMEAPVCGDLDARARGGLEVDPRCNSGDLSRVRAEAVDGRNNRDSQYSAFWQYVSREVQGGIWPADTRCALWRHFNVGGMSLQNGWLI